MQASSQSGNLVLQMDGDEAAEFRRYVKVAVAALVTLYAREGMVEAKAFFSKVAKTLEEADRR